MPDRHRLRWTPKEEKHLRNLWGTMTIEGVAAAMGRTVVSVFCKAKAIGVQMGATQGQEYVTAAAARCGYGNNTGQLRRILVWAGVKIHRTVTMRRGRRHFTCHVVDSFDVDDAIARYHATETIFAASKRLGVDSRWLDARLRKAGVDIRAVPYDPKRATGKRGRLHQRVDASVIDRVVAEHLTYEARTELVQDAARRIGVAPCYLRRWLTEAGVPRTHRIWRVDPETVNRVVLERIARKPARGTRIMPRPLRDRLLAAITPPKTEEKAA